MHRKSTYLSIVAVALFGQYARGSVTVTFSLLIWDDTDATTELASAVGVKPSPVYPIAGDWFLFTNDDEQLPSTYNPLGAASHNFADITGVGGSGFNQAPSLLGDDALTLELSCDPPGVWDVRVLGQAYLGTATPVMQVNQFLVQSGDPAAQNPAFNVDGLGNDGTWSASAAYDWEISYELDFYFAVSADGDPTGEDIDATFNNKQQVGYLIPVAELTPEGLASVALDDPAGHFDGDFERYLLDEIVIRLPPDAVYLLITQMNMTNPGYAEPGLPITTASLIGNTTIAYTTQAIPIFPGDADGNGYVDVRDIEIFTSCVAGPVAAPSPAEPWSEGTCHCVFDLDADNDVDLRDFAGLQQMMAE